MRAELTGPKTCSMDHRRTAASSSEAQTEQTTLANAEIDHFTGHVVDADESDSVARINCDLNYAHAHRRHWRVHRQRLAACVTH